MKLLLLVVSLIINIIKADISVFLDLNRQSECNEVENQLANEASESARQRDELIKWGDQRMETILGLNTSFQVVDTCGNVTLTASRILALAFAVLEKPTAGSTIINNNNTRKAPVKSSIAECAGYVLLASNLENSVTHDLSQVLFKPSWSLLSPPEDELLAEQGSVIAMANRLQWKYVVVVLDNDFLMERFNEALAREDICVVANIFINTNKSNDLTKASVRIREEIRAVNVRNVILISRSTHISQLLRQNDDGGKSDNNLNWIVSRPESTIDLDANLVGSDVVYVMQNRFLRVPEFANYYRNLSSHANKSFEDPILPHLLRALYGLSTSPTPLPPQTCSSTAANFPSWNEVRDKLQISLQPSNVDALLVTKVSRSLQKLGEYQLGRGLMLTPPFQDDLLPGESRRGVETCFECQCQNFNIIPLEPGLKWKEDTWITIMATLASLGIGLALGLGLFLAGKVCTEVLEASQATSFFMLFAIVLSYTCFVPFGFEATEEICFWRIMGTRVAFVFLFSLLLSRSIMLATSDLDGLPGHITGSIQLALGSFMMIVELALILREWFLKQENDAFSSSFIVDGKYEKLECQTGNGDFYLRHLLYASLLLAFQLLISPCIVASRRNYREGLLFALASFSTLMVWIGWTSAFYIFVEEKWQDVSICCGLLATPTVIILVVFIPKCYLLTTTSASAAYKSELNLQGLGPHYSGSSSNDIVLSRSTSSRLSHIEAITDTTNMENTEDINNSLAAIGSIASRVHQGQGGQYESSLKVKGLATHPSGTANNYVIPRPNSVYSGYRGTDARLPQFLAAGLPCDSPEHSLAVSEYPTYKLDQNTVVDTSISWQRTNNRLV